MDPTSQTATCVHDGPAPRITPTRPLYTTRLQWHLMRVEAQGGCSSANQKPPTRYPSLSALPVWEGRALRSGTALGAKEHVLGDPAKPVPYKKKRPPPTAHRLPPQMAGDRSRHGFFI